MKYKRGSIVEVFCYQSWRCARIVSSKGHNYTVSYDVYPGFTNKDDVERVSAKSIRPCAPLLKVSESWTSGDVAEVFHNLSWKMAVVVNDSGWGQFKVRLVGFPRVFDVNKSELRVRQSYQDGEWFVIGKMKVPSDHKDSSSHNLLKHGQDLHETGGKRESYTKDLYFDTQNNCHLVGSRVIFSKKRKRSSPCGYFQDEADENRGLSEKACRRDPGRRTLPEKVDAVANRIYRKKDINRTSGHESSSGSCSINSYKQYEIHHGPGYDEDSGYHESDAESVCKLEYHEESHSRSLSQSQSQSQEIHRLELDAYRDTMTALHASGPLTWEKETMGQSIDLHTLLLHL